jgi:hypothetical protein
VTRRRRPVALVEPVDQAVVADALRRALSGREPIAPYAPPPPPRPELPPELRDANLDLWREIVGIPVVGGGSG